MHHCSNYSAHLHGRHTNAILFRLQFNLQPNDVTKQIQQQDLIPKLRESLKIEQKHLIQYWIGAEYQDKLRKYASIADTI